MQSCGYQSYAIDVSGVTGGSARWQGGALNDIAEGGEVLGVLGYAEGDSVTVALDSQLNSRVNVGCLTGVSHTFGKSTSGYGVRDSGGPGWCGGSGFINPDFFRILEAGLQLSRLAWCYSTILFGNLGCGSNLWHVLNLHC